MSTNCAEPPVRRYLLDFTNADWDEIECLGFGEFQPQPSMPRAEWVAVGLLALGKAQRIDEGFYDLSEAAAGDDAIWAAQLRCIAAQIFNKFQPGDGQL